MKKLQRYRLGVQLSSLMLSMLGLIISLKSTAVIIAGLAMTCGVFYCGWICPFGLTQEMFSKLGDKLGIKKRKMPIKVQKILVYSRYIIFLLLVFVGGEFIFSMMSMDPRASFGRMVLGNVPKIGGLLIIVLFILISIFFERPFCNYFCYEGGRYGIMSVFRLFTISRKESSCVNCKRCDKVCPMNIEVSKCKKLRSPQCINCFKCVSNCPIDDTLLYGRVQMNKKELSRYFGAILLVGMIVAGKFVYNNVRTVDDVNIQNNIKGEAEGIPDGEYTGEGEGFNGMVTVKVRVSDEIITGIEVTQNMDDAQWFNRANRTIPSKIIETQSTEIDLVSGATYSSRGIRDAVKDALHNAKRL